MARPKKKEFDDPGQGMMFGIQPNFAPQPAPAPAVQPAPIAEKIVIIHRKNFGMVRQRIELLDKRTGDPHKLATLKNEAKWIERRMDKMNSSTEPFTFHKLKDALKEKRQEINSHKCHTFCRDATAWTNYGLENVRYPPKLVPASVFDAQNEAEIIAFLSSIGLKKLYRPTELDQLTVERTPFGELMAKIVHDGKWSLQNHWLLTDGNWERPVLLDDDELNPYENTFNSMIERFSLVPEADQNVMREILLAKARSPRIDFPCRKDIWKEDSDGRHVKRAETGMEKQFDDERKLAGIVFDYFTMRQELLDTQGKDEKKTTE